MSDLDELLIRWQDAGLGLAEQAELKRLLVDPANRAAAVRHLHASAAILESLREEGAAAATSAGPATERLRSVGRSIRASQGAANAARTPRQRSAPRAHRARSVRLTTLGAVVAVVILVLTCFGVTLVQRTTTTPAMPTLAVVEASSTSGAAGYLVRAATDPGDAVATRLPLTPGTTIGAGDRIDTGDGDLRLRFSNEATTLTLATGTRLALIELPDRREVLLDAGSVEAVVAKQPAGRALVFVTAQATACVIGTRLSVIAGAAETRLAVSEGRVRFKAVAGGDSVEIGANESAVATSSGVRRDGAQALTGPLVPTHGCLWGVSLRAEATAPAAASELEAAVGRRMAVVHQYQGFSDYERERPFPSATQRAWAAAGRLLAIDWKPRQGEQQLRWSDVAEGIYDADCVDVLARKAAAWGHPFFLSLHHDPAEAVGPAGSGMTVADYVRMWHHVHARFVAAGAQQVVWVWTMSSWPDPAASWSACYPGDDCVDWLACTAYNNLKPGEQRMHWRSLSDLVTPFVGWAREHARDGHGQAKPIMLSVYACAEDTEPAPTKADWFRALPAQLAALPEIKAAIYFHDRALRADSTPEALAGFRAAGDDPFFITDGPPPVRGISP